MNRDYAAAHYISSRVEDRKEGFEGLELHRTAQGKQDRIARIIFWDAFGQFFVETFGAEVPLDILEELIAEAKQSIKIR